jgi:hypothetical protein
VDEQGNEMVVEIDTNGDALTDVVASPEPDGGYRLQLDIDGDSVVDSDSIYSREDLEAVAPTLLSVLDDAFGVGSDDGRMSDLVVDGQLVGDPQGDAQYWFQQAANGFCLPASIAQIASEYTGVSYTDESAFVELANTHGLFQVDGQGVPGISFADGLVLLQEAGVPASLEYGSQEVLLDYLAEGRGIVLFLDSGEVWEGEAAEDQAPDHAVVVTGVDLATGTVFLSDPGSPNGNMEQVPMDVLLDAWQDSDFQMIVCDEPAPEPIGTAGTAGSAETSADRAVEQAVVRPAGWVMLPVVLPATS